MKAIVQPEYGSPDVLRLEEVDRPVLGDNDVLIRVHAASVCRGDVHILTGTPYLLRLMGYGLLRPKNRPGQDVSGRVEAIGDNVTSLQPGDEVYGQVRHGGFAEYVAGPADHFAPKPTNITFEQAAAVPDSGMTALQGLRDVGQLQPGQKVLINGASGGVGTFAVQIAKSLGAEVTAVCSTRHVDKVRSIGADHVIDYTQDDFTRHAQRYDVMFDLVGNRSVSDCKSILHPKGVYVASAGELGGNWVGPIVWLLGVALAGAVASQKMTTFVMTPNKDDLLFLKELLEAGKVTPVIERQYSLDDTADALRHVAEGHAQGKTVLSTSH
jgi:NADPH:quinone reductase-like Zn-dependent oxidoreductase